MQGRETGLSTEKGSSGQTAGFLTCCLAKETIAEAEAGIPYDEQVGMVNREVERKRKELRTKHGFFYKWKIQAQDMKQDVQGATNYVNTLRGSKKPKSTNQINGKNDNM